MISVNAPYHSTFTVLNDLGSPADAATVQLTVTKPDMTTTVLTLAGGGIIRDGLGLYHVDYTPTVEGLYRFDWASTGPVRVLTEYENANLWRSAVGLADMRGYLNLADTSRDSLLRGYLQAATELAEDTVGTTVPRVITGERVLGAGQWTVRLVSAPVMPDSDITISSIWPGGPSWTQDVLNVSYATGVVRTLDFIGFWYGPWTATYTAGRSIIPMNVQLAIKEIVADLWATQRGQLTDSLMPDQMAEAEIEARIPPGYEMPASAKNRLKAVGPVPGFA